MGIRPRPSLSITQKKWRPRFTVVRLPPPNDKALLCCSSNHDDSACAAVRNPQPTDTRRVSRTRQRTSGQLRLERKYGDDDFDLAFDVTGSNSGGVPPSWRRSA